MSKKCLRCGAELSDHAKFCDKCGTAVPDQPQTLYCQKCGAKLELGTKFCGNCGTPVGSTTGQEFQQFADSARAAAQAGMENAKRGAAKGMAFAAEKMASAAEKMKQQSSDATGQGTPSNGAIHTNEWEQRTGKDSFNSADSTGETVASPPKKKSIRTILIGVGVAVFLLFVIIAIFSGDAVDTVKNSNLDDYPEMTVGDACDTRFTSGKWTSEEREGITYVIFRGNDPDTISDWEIEFKVLDNQFRVESITVDGIYYSDNLSISALIDYIYTGNYDLLIGYAFLDALLS